MHKDYPPLNSLTLKTQAMPSHTNPAGDIFGGWLMSQMDIASSLRASEEAGGRVVTKAVKEIIFEKPVKVGDTVYIYADIFKIGRTSITIKLQTWVRRYLSRDHEKIAEALFVMVALNEKGQSRTVLASKE